MKLGKVLLMLFAGVSLSGAAMAAKPGATTVPLHTVKMVGETVSLGTLADANIRERVIRTIRVIRSERHARSERFEGRHERWGERRHERWGERSRERRHERHHERRS